MSATTLFGLRQSKCNYSTLSRRPSDVDYITNLPENVLSIILSRLPTEDAVRTSILSKDWVRKWTSVYNIDIVNDRGIPYVLFVKFMDRMLCLTPFLRNFCLTSLADHVSCDVQRWISTALRHSLESLEVICHTKDIVFPCSLLNSTSLRKLKLYFYHGMLNIAAKNFAPNLTTLDLLDIMIVNGDPNTSLVTFNFPSLETFRTRRCEWSNVKSVELYAPSLTEFCSYAPNIDKDYDYSFVIHAPRLAKFNGGESIPEKIDVIYGSSIVSAEFYISYDLDNLKLRKNIGSRVGKLFNEFINLQKLELTMSEVISLTGTPLRPHDKLRELDIRSSSNAEQLLALLHVSPSLKLLTINVYDWIDYDYGRIPTVPSCIVSHLEEIVFIGFKCERHHYNLAKFLLENGEQLKKITFVGEPDSRKKQRKIKDYISAFRVVYVVFVKNRNALNKPT